MKLALLCFHVPDELLDPLQRKFIAHAPCDLAVVVDPPIEFFALLGLRVSRDREHGFQRIVSNDFSAS